MKTAPSEEVLSVVQVVPLNVFVPGDVGSLTLSMILRQTKLFFSFQKTAKKCEYDLGMLLKQETTIKIEGKDEVACDAY